MWGVKDCRWTQLGLGPANDPIAFLVGGSATYSAGVRCTYGERNIMRNWRTSRIGDTDRQQLTFVSFMMTDLHLTAFGREQTIVVSDDELAQEWLPSFSCDRSAPPVPPGGHGQGPTTTVPSTTAP